MNEPKQPCEVCGEIEPKSWEIYDRESCERGGLDYKWVKEERKKRPGEIIGFAWAGHWTNCPLCGHLALYLNMGGYDPETKKSVRFGAPQWVYDLYDGKYGVPDEPAIVEGP